MESQFHKVNRNEFEDFIKKYPRALERHIVAFCTPPMITYNDFERGGYAKKSIVAYTFMYDDDPDEWCYVPEEEKEYYVLK